VSFGKNIIHFTAAVSVVFVASVHSADDYEQPPVFKASEILANVPETLSGANFKVREEVQNDGYWDFYTIDTPFGVFYAHGWFDLRNTIREINAIAYLEEISETQVFAEAVLAKGLEPVELASQIFRHPIQTVRNMPSGIVQMFRRYAQRAREILELAGKLASGEKIVKPDDPRLSEACERGQGPYPGACDQEGYADDFTRLARRYFDVNDASREFHMELGTDPYSSNEVLQEAILRLSWFGGIGEFGMRKLNPFREVKTAGLVARVYRLTWNKNPVELRKYLDRTLAEDGISEEKRRYFLNNPYLTPSKQAFIVMSVEKMDGVPGREHLLDWTADSRNEDEALYSLATVALIAWYHGQYGVKSFVPNALLPAVENEEGAHISLLPIDHLSWTEEVATIVRAAAVAAETAPDQPRVLWLLNRASERARREIEALGYTVFEDGYRDVVASGSTLDLDVSTPEADPSYE